MKKKKEFLLIKILAIAKLDFMMIELMKIVVQIILIFMKASVF